MRDKTEKSWPTRALSRQARRCWRFLVLAFECVRAGADFAIHVLLKGRAASFEARSLWLHRNCRRTLRTVFQLSIDCTGPVPREGLLVSNHLGYLDILVLAAIRPVVFVSKNEVRAWPVFGWFARLAGTLFLDRSCRRDVGRTTRRMDEALAAGLVVVLFPEGTTSDGATVLPFRSALLEPVAGGRYPVACAGAGFELAEGEAGLDVCYWGDMTLLPHLWSLMGKHGLSARIVFGCSRRRAGDRKTLAHELHAEVAGLLDQVRFVRRLHQPVQIPEPQPQPTTASRLPATAATRSLMARGVPPL